MNPLVSVIIPVYQVEKYIHRCMDSILGQTYDNIEIILVDDGSPDNCPIICDQYAKADERVKVIHKTNGGLSDARNEGLKHISGKYVFFVDSDDFIDRNAIKYMVDLAENHCADIVQCDRELGTGDSFSADAFQNKDQINIYNNITIFESPQNQVTIWAKLYLSSLWSDILMPVGKLNEDDYTTWKLYYKAPKIVVSRRKLYYNYINPSGICSTLKKAPNITFPIEAYHERIAFFDKINEKHLSDLSKWRFMKYILLSYRNQRLSTEQRSVLRNEFHSIRHDVLACKNVPFIEKILIMIFSLSPSVSNFLLNRIR